MLLKAVIEIYGQAVGICRLVQAETRALQKYIFLSCVSSMVQVGSSYTEPVLYQIKDKIIQISFLLKFYKL